MKVNQHIEIVSSNTRGLSSMSQESRSAAYSVLTRHYSSVGITVVNNLSDLELLAAKLPDLVFLGMKFIPLEPNDLRGPKRIWLSEYFDRRGIAYTGSAQAAHRLELDKSLAKQRVLDAGLNTSPFCVIKQDQLIARPAGLSFPLFVKPVDRGGGSGIDSQSVVHNLRNLQLKFRTLARDLQSDSLVEHYLNGREFSVAILKNEFSEEFSVMPIELVAEADTEGVQLLSGAVKSSNAETVLKVTNGVLRAKICKLALDVFHAIGARDYGRIDIRLDEFGVPNFLEANLLPSLISGYGSFPKACLLNIGLGYDDMIMKIVRLGLARSASNDKGIIDSGAINIPGLASGVGILKPA